MNYMQHEMQYKVEKNQLGKQFTQQAKFSLEQKTQQIQQQIQQTQQMQKISPKQQGLSLVGLIICLAVLSLIAILGFRIVPSTIEYFAIKKAIVDAKVVGGSVSEIRDAFDRQARVGYITAVAGKDLDIVKEGDDQADIAFSYQKNISLFGPVSLTITYEGSTPGYHPIKKKPTSATQPAAC